VSARRWFIAIAVAAGVLSGVVYHAAIRQADVVVAARDVDVPRALSRDDLEVRALSAEVVPADAIRRIDEAVGLVPRTPLLRGQILFQRGLAVELTDLRSGAALLAGQRAVAIPVSAVNAVGGAVVPGSRVDVVAVPVLGRAPAGRTVEVLATSALVLDVRGESGSALVVRDQKAAVGGDRIGSVVIAIASADAMRFADRIATSTFVLALAGRA
jgi:pilus assembly protein CpaB